MNKNYLVRLDCMKHKDNYESTAWLYSEDTKELMKCSVPMTSQNDFAVFFKDKNTCLLPETDFCFHDKDSGLYMSALLENSAQWPGMWEPGGFYAMRAVTGYNSLNLDDCFESSNKLFPDFRFDKKLYLQADADSLYHDFSTSKISAIRLYHDPDLYEGPSDDYFIHEKNSLMRISDPNTVVLYHNEFPVVAIMGSSSAIKDFMDVCKTDEYANRLCGDEHLYDVVQSVIDKGNASTNPKRRLPDISDISAGENELEIDG